MTPIKAPSTDRSDPHDFARQAGPLLKEYAPILRELTRRGLELKPSLTGLFPDSNEYDRIRSRFLYLQAPSEELIRQASAIVEEAKMDRLDRVALWLALADFESAFLQAKEVLSERASDMQKSPPSKQRGKS